jgi:diacylglycerol kinase
MLRSFKYAVRGVAAALAGRNIRIMAACFVLIIPVCFLLGLSAIEWAVVLLCCAGVISLEMVNTALESAVDIATTEYKPLAKKAKDIAAGAVLVFSIISASVGLIIFVPHIIRLISGAR